MARAHQSPRVARSLPLTRLVRFGEFGEFGPNESAHEHVQMCVPYGVGPVDLG